MDYARLVLAVRNIGQEGHDAFELHFRDGSFVEVPMGEDDSALTFRDRDGFVVFEVGGKPRTSAIRLADVVAVRTVIKRRHSD